MSENKDIQIKFLCKILFNRMGFITHYEIRLRNKSYINIMKTHDVSDIDVLGYNFLPDLSSLTIGSECKSGDSGALDEFYKFLGISEYFKLDRSYLIKTKIHQNARQIALTRNFTCLTEAELRKLVIGFGVDIDKAIKIERGRYSRLVNSLNAYKSLNERLIEYLTLDYWNKETWRNIHNLLHILKNKPLTLINEYGTMEKYVHYYVLELFSVLILKIIHEAMILNYSDIENALINSLYGGAESLNERRRIQDALNIATKRNDSFESIWQDDLVSICSRFSQHTHPTSLIPKLFQMFYEQFIYDKDVKIDAKKIKALPDYTRKFSQDIAQFISKYGEIDIKNFEELMSL